ncbi:hypothetical protein N431DRAFT_361098, partial [Stipitochalara longipes BDJ]
MDVVANSQAVPADEHEDEAVLLLRRPSLRTSLQTSPTSPPSPSSPHSPTSSPNSSRIYQLAGQTLPHVFSINILWVFAPLGLFSGALSWNTVLISVFNFLAIIPLSAAVSDASDHLSDAFGDLFGALINATFGNAVELIVGILAVAHGDTGFAQSIMLGSILSDILFVLGSCFLSAALHTPLLSLNRAVSGSLSSLMIITAVALVLPTALYSTFETLSDSIDINAQVLGFSRGTAVVLLVLYIAYLYFEFVTHKELFEGPPEDDVDPSTSPSTSAPPTPATRRGTWLQDPTANTSTEDSAADTNSNPDSFLSLLPTVTILLAATAGIMLSSHFMLSSIPATSLSLSISRTFIATILIPIASNAPECATVLHTPTDFAVGVIVGSILQIALFVIPALVILGAMLGKGMTLNFDTFQTVILFLSIILVNQVLMNGRYTYMHGLLLVALYAVIAVAFFLRDDI